MSRGPLRRLFPRGVKRLGQVLHNHLRLALGLRGARGLLPGRRDRAFQSEKSGGAQAEVKASVLWLEKSPFQLRGKPEAELIVWGASS